MKKSLYKTDVKFCIDGKDIEFSVMSDLHDYAENAVINWLFRARKFTASSFANYVNKKGVHRVVLIKQ